MLIESLEHRLLFYTGNILTGSSPNGLDEEIRLFDQSGKQLASKLVPGGSADFQVDASGNLQVFGGGPTLKRLNGALTLPGNWVDEKTVPGWSQFGRTFHGGLAVFGQYVYACDESNGSAGDARGLIRFDSRNGYAFTRFATDQNFSDVSLGNDGKLYAIESGQSIQHVVFVYDPLTLKLVKTVNVPGFDDACVTADSSGNIYVGEFYGPLYKCSPTGAVLKKSTFGGPVDIDIAADNTLLTSTADEIRLVDTNLNQLKFFRAGSYTGTTFVAFAKYQAPPPRPTASIAGNVFNDLDADGVKDVGEGGLSAWKLFLDADKDGVLDATEKTATTDASGNYKFTGLAAGTYRVREVLKTGFRRTAPLAGFADVTLTSGQSVTGKNFANTQKILITGNVFNDANGDKLKNATEKGLRAWRVFIDKDKDGIFDAGEASVLTDANGFWVFKALSAGTYVVRVVQQSGWTRTTPSGAGSFTLTVASGGSSTGKSFGEKKLA
jgi:hypothetical protein